MRSHSRRFLKSLRCLRTVSLFLLSVAVVGGPTQAQSPQPTVAEPIEPVELSVDAIESRKAQIEQSAEIGGDLKSQIAEAYTGAIEQVRRAEQLRQEAAELETLRAGAPERLKEIRNQLSQPAPEVKPDVPPDASLQQLEQFLAQHEAELKALQNEAAALEEERKRRADRRSKLPEETSVARQALEDVERQLTTAAPAGEPPELTGARRTLLAARQRALKAELDKYEKEILSYDARGELLAARRELLARKSAQKEALVKAWREIVNERRRTEAQRAAAEAERKRREAARAHPVVRRLAEENVEIAEGRAARQLADKIAASTARLEEIHRLHERYREEFSRIREKVEAAGLTPAMGLLLRRNLEHLPSTAAFEAEIERLQSQAARVQVETIDAEKLRSDLVNLEPHVEEAMAELDPGVGERDREEIERAVRELLRSRYEYVDALVNDYDAYLRVLVDLSNAERQLIRQVEAYAGYIRENVLWVPSTSPPQLADLGDIAAAAAWLTDPDSWRDVGSSSLGYWREAPVALAFAVLILLALLVLRRRLKRTITEIGETAGRSMTASIAPTLSATLVTVLLALPWPAVVWCVGHWTSVPFEAPEFARAVGGGLKATAGLFLTAELLRQILRPGGLADKHFDWPDRSRRLVRRHLLWLMGIGLPVVFVVATLEGQALEEHQASLGRLAFIVGQVALAVFVQRIMRPHGGILQERLTRNIGGWLDRLRYVWYPGLVMIPLVLAGLSLWGYYYTALQLTFRLQATTWIVLGLFVAYSILLRWVLVAHRRLAIEQYRKRRAAAQAEARSADAGGGDVATPDTTQPALDLTAISLQTRNLTRSFVAVVMVIALWFVWVDVLPALRVLDQWTLWTTTVVEGGEGAPVATVPITVGDVLLGFIVLLMTFLAGKNVPGLLEIAVLQRLPLEPSSRYAITTVSRYMITIVGLVIAFGAIGISWSKVQWLAAAITVGLGFGLQEIFANFVSGLIILFERPIRVGDTVTVGGVSGTVMRIRMRATTVADWDRKELVIPNKEFVTGQVINWSLTDSILRAVIPVGIAYGSDTRLAHQLLLQCARENDRVLADPAPVAFFLGFGDNSLNFELRVYVRDITEFLPVRHEIHHAIDDAFRDAGITIAFPQRDVHLDTSSPLQIQLLGDGGSGGDGSAPPRADVAAASPSPRSPGT